MKQRTIDNGQWTKKKLSNAFGFTLIELLVVVTIIAILSIIGIAIFTDVQKSARDARRKVDIDAIAGVLEAAYNSANNIYPTEISDDMFSSGKKPVDPLGTTPYTYNENFDPTGAGPGTGYIVCAKMEKGGGNSDGIALANNGTTYYCRRSLQN